ncbi:MAG: hypothetical protein V1915_03630 [Candidatus Bathyarchaeota archaeon]
MSDLLIPMGKKSRAEELIPLAARPSTLTGKTVALYHNDKVASFPVLKTVGELLKEKTDVQEVFEVHSQTPYMKHPERAIQEALKADVVIAGTCD